MSGGNSLFGCFTCRKHPPTSRKFTKFKQNGTHGVDSLTNSPSETDLPHFPNIGTKLNDGSVKETVSLSTTSHTPAYADTASASLGGWSSAHQTDGFDVSKVNLLPSEDSCSVLPPLLGVCSRPTDSNDECLERLESIVKRLERLAGVPCTQVDDTALLAFQSLIDKKLPLYMTLSCELGPEIKRQSRHVREAFELVQDLIKFSTKYSKPPPHILEDYYKPLSYKLLEVSDFDRHHSDPLCRHALITVADSAVALAWCSCQTASVFVREIREGILAFANKTFQYCHSNYTRHAEWIRAWMVCITGLQEVVDAHFRYGLLWAPDGLKAPPPPKVLRPLLNYDRHEAPAIANCFTQKTSRCFTALRDRDRKIDSQAQLLSEISRTKQHLRHVYNPELWQ